MAGLDLRACLARSEAAGCEHWILERLLLAGEAAVVAASVARTIDECRARQAG